MALCHEPYFCAKNLKKTLLEIKQLIVNPDFAQFQHHFTA
jgi:hypothetical protein